MKKTFLSLITSVLFLTVILISSATADAAPKKNKTTKATPEKVTQTTPEKATQATPLDLSTVLPLDPSVRYGELPNGLKYYIKHNEKPKGRVSMRLAVNAGSINETDAQSGLAHVTEHLLFNGTKNFPKNELINFLQKTGMKFGADINAYTSFDETVYMLELATDNPDFVKKGMQVLEDWAHQASLEDSAIDDERGVIIEEWRGRLGASDRMMRKTFPVLFSGSLYANRLPIGFGEEQLRTFKHEELRKFYRDFYRPNLQAVAVVGDIDVDDIEKQIKEHFSPIQNPANPVKRISVTVPDNKEPLVVVATDKEAMSSMVQLLFKKPKQTLATVGDYRKNMIEQLAGQMINARFEEAGQDPQAPFIYCFVGNGSYVRTMDMTYLYGVAKENQIEATLAVLLQEAKRVETYGFNQSELDRAKESMLKQYESQAKEADKTNSDAFAREYVSLFLEGNAAPGIAYEYDLVKRILPTITVEDCSNMAQSNITEENQVVIVQAPEKEGVNVPTEDVLKQILTMMKDVPVEPYNDNFVAEPLVVLPKKPASGAKTELVSQLQLIYKITLSNGVTVTVKPTQLKNDQILFSGYALGGTSTVDLSNFLSAQEASSIQSESGTGKFDYIELTKQLQGKNVSYNASVGGLRANISGSASPDDLETLLQLNYLNFTAPRKDPKAFEAYISKMENQLKNMLSNPTYSFYDTLLRTVSNNDPRFVFVMTPEQLKQVNLDNAYNFYVSQYSNPANFNFYMVGNFTINDNLLSLLETYLGSLPVQPRNGAWKDVSVPFPPKTIDGKFVKGMEEKGMVGLVFDIEGFDWDSEERLALSFYKEIVQIKLTEVIREKLGGVYSPQMQLGFEKYPKPEGNLMILFGCDPHRADELTNAVFEEMKKILADGPTPEDLAKVQELHKRNFETGMQENRFWQSRLQDVDYIGYDINQADLDVQIKRAQAVTADILKTVANKYINLNHYVRMVLVPESTPESTPEKK
ncbi:MAG: insulinase family protein [Bacteroidales bacterium]|jgi:zinc protease|nr:insulinase family protein [Bacteroidales bacterium]